MENFLRVLRAGAYDALDVSGHTIDDQGWMDPAFVSVFGDAIRAVDRQSELRVIEVGSWKGRSALAMGRSCRDAGFVRFSIVAVDTWLGAPEFLTTAGFTDLSRGGSLLRHNGYPTVFYTFTKNVKTAGLDDHITPLPISSVQGADVLRHYGCKADVIYIDAAHEYEAVKADLNAYFPLLQPVSGVMIGDDYSPGWPGVVRAVDEFAAERGLRLDVTGVVWQLGRG